MSKRKSAKYKLDRRMGENVFGRPKSPVNRREYGPGQHGQRRKGKVSDFGLQLRAKQKLKGYYGDVTEKQFKQTFQHASKMKGDASQNLIGLLERRLDMIVYRAKFAPTIWAARQLVSHGHIRVNGIKCNIASRRCDVNDIIELGPKAQEMALVMEAQSLAERDIFRHVALGEALGFHHQRHFLRLFAERDLAADVATARGDVALHAVHENMAVADQLAGGPDGRRELGAIDDHVEPTLK